MIPFPLALVCFLYFSLGSTLSFIKLFFSILQTVVYHGRTTKHSLVLSVLRIPIFLFCVLTVRMALTLASVKASACERAPFSPNIRDFVHESRRRQTFFANCEASSKKIVEGIENSQILEHRIYYSIFSRESDFAADSNLSPKPEDPNFGRAREIAKTMISLSRRFGSNNEIHFSVVWVFYFVYKTKAVLSVPVFKVYKKKFGKDAVFLDLNLLVCRSWDQYLDSIMLPESFLCVPRNGEYIFFDELDLEYLRCSCETNFISKNTKPFSMTVFRPMLDKTLRFCKEDWDIVKFFVMKHKESILEALVCAIGVCLYPSAVCDNYLKLVSMVLNKAPFCPNEMGPTTLATSVTPAAEFSALEKALNDLIELFQKPKRNWDDILLAVGALLWKNMRCDLGFFNISCLPPFIRKLLTFCCKMYGVKVKKSQVLQSNSDQPPCEVFKENLKLLNETSLEKIDLSTALSDNITSPQLIDELDGQRIYVMPQGPITDMVKDVEVLTGVTNPCFDFEKNTVCRVKSSQGNIAGSIYFLKNDVCVGLFPLKKSDI